MIGINPDRGGRCSAGGDSHRVQKPGCDSPDRGDRIQYCVSLSPLSGLSDLRFTGPVAQATVRTYVAPTGARVPEIVKRSS